MSDIKFYIGPMSKNVVDSVIELEAASIFTPLINISDFFKYLANSNLFNGGKCLIFLNLYPLGICPIYV